MIDVVDGAAQEREKYDEIWGTIPEYRDHSPGLVNVDRFMEVMPGHAVRTGLDFPGKLIDIGCGAGVAGAEFIRRGFDVVFTDISNKGVGWGEMRPHKFVQGPLWDDATWLRCGVFDYGFCCDVMEHIPPEYTMLVIHQALANCSVVWFQIALRPDEFGKTIGQPLHLTVQNFQWWLTRLATLGEVLDARDLCGDGLYIVRRE